MPNENHDRRRRIDFTATFQDMIPLYRGVERVWIDENGVLFAELVGDNIQELGPVSSYYYALQSGYTGTFEEWVQTLLDSSVNASSAAQSAENAYTSELNAATSEANALQSATNAHEYAEYIAENAIHGPQTMIASPFVVAQENPPQSFVRWDNKLYFFPYGHEANASWEDTLKVETDIGEQLRYLRDTGAQIDDTAGEGDTTVAWSADKIVETFDDYTNTIPIDFGVVSSLPVTVTDPQILATMCLDHFDIDNKDAFMVDPELLIEDGQVTLSGILAEGETSSLVVYLAHNPLITESSIDIDTTLQISGAAADACVTGAELNKKMEKPKFNGVYGQVLRTNGLGGTFWDSEASTSDITNAVDDYLAENFSNPSNPPLDRTLRSVASAAPADLVGRLKDEVSSTQNTNKNNVDLDVTDETGNVLVRLKNGHIQTKKFSSTEVGDLRKELANAGKSARTNRENVDLDLIDINGNVILRLQDGEIQTKNFNSANISDLYDENVVTSKTAITDKNNVDLDIVDRWGNVVLRIAGGHIQTKNFNSANSAGGSPYSSYTIPTSSTSDMDVIDNNGNVLLRLEGGHIKMKNFDSSNAATTEDINNIEQEIDASKRIKTRMKFGAHNGAEYYAPECTVPAYRIAGQQGWEYAWIAGIDFSTDGTMFVIHDDTVNRTTNGSGYLNQMSDLEINALNIDQTGPGYSLSQFDPLELKIPTFEKVLQQCVKYGMKMVIRLSLFPKEINTAADQQKWDNFIQLLADYGVPPEDVSCYVSVLGQAEICRTLLGQDVEIATFLGNRALAQDYVDWFEERNITGRRAAIISVDNVDLAATKLLHRNGIRVYAYKENITEVEASNCALLGVDVLQNGKTYRINN